MVDVNDVTIRALAPPDLEQVVNVERSVYGSGTYSTYFFRQLYDLFPGLLLVAELDDRLVGHACGAISRERTTGWIVNAAVLPRYRRQGIGRRLLEACMDALKGAGVTCIKVTSEPDNRAALKLYDRLGFQEVGSEVDYYGDGQERLILEYHS